MTFFFVCLCNSTESVELSTSFIKENLQLSQHSSVNPSEGRQVNLKEKS